MVLLSNKRKTLLNFHLSVPPQVPSRYSTTLQCLLYHEASKAFMFVCSFH